MRKSVIEVSRMAMQLMSTVQLTKNCEWNDKTANSYISMSYDGIKKVLKEKVADITEWTVDELEIIGFVRCGDILMMPLWILEFIPNGTVLSDLDGNAVIVGSHFINNSDIRQGCIGYGFKIVE